MSAINGDKSRFNRARKQRIAQRSRNRKLVQSLGQEGRKKSVSRPKAVSE